MITMKATVLKVILSSRSWWGVSWESSVFHDLGEHPGVPLELAELPCAISHFLVPSHPGQVQLCSAAHGLPRMFTASEETAFMIFIKKGIPRRYEQSWNKAEARGLFQALLRVARKWEKQAMIWSGRAT